jgi:hypothetical protein
MAADGRNVREPARRQGIECVGPSALVFFSDEDNTACEASKPRAAFNRRQAWHEEYDVIIGLRQR